MNIGQDGPPGQATATPTANNTPASNPPDIAPKTAAHIDAPLIALEQERAELQAQANAQDGGEAAGTLQDRATRVEHEIADTPATGPVGVAIKLRRLERTFQASGGAPWDQQNFDTALAALNRMGDVNLILMEQEHNWRYFETKFPEDSKEADENTDKIAALAREIATRPAHTAVGAMVKLRVMREYQRHSTADWYGASCDTALDALMGSVHVAPVAACNNPDAKLFALEADAALQDLWREYQQCLKDWGPDETPEDEKARDRSFELERQIVETPAQSIFGVAVKLWIATHDNLPHKEPEYTDEKALVAACDDAVRLAGIGGAA